MEILKWLDSSKIIKSYDVVDYRNWNTGRYFKITIHFKNNSILYAKEYFDLKERNYSFHWQDGNGNLLIRWDNSPIIKTPKHTLCNKHMHREITESYAIPPHTFY